MSALPAIQLGVSACLLGEPVRYDGRDKRDLYISETLARSFTLVPLCPEVAIGLGVPRPPIRLVAVAERTHAVGVQDPTLDVTDRLAAYGADTAVRHSELSGYVLKSRSPSCGVNDVEIMQAAGRTSSGRGIFAEALTSTLPLLPVIDESMLADPAQRDNFLERVFAYRRWRAFVKEGVTAAGLVDFHVAHKLALLTHGREHYTALGQLVASNDGEVVERARRYGEEFMRALAVPSTRGRHADALTHAAGFLKQQLPASERHVLRDSIEHYRTSDEPLSTPIRRLCDCFKSYPDAWIARQVYLYPDPRELALRYESR